MAKKKSTSLVHVDFEDFTLEDAEEIAREAEQNATQGRILKLRPGRTVLRVLPAPKGEKLFRVAYVHYLDVPGVGRVSFNCPRLMAKRPCSVCKTEAELLATGEDVDFRKSRKIKAKRQVFFNVIDRGNEEAGPQPFRFGKTIEDQLIEIRQDEDDGGNFSHPTNGFDIKFSRKGEGMNDTEYKLTVTGPNPKPLSDDPEQMREWIEEQPDLSRFLRVLSDEAIGRKLRGEDGDDDDDDTPKRRRGRDEERGRGRSSSRRSSRDEDDEDEAPRRSSKRASRTVDEEIEEIDLDDIPY